MPFQTFYNLPEDKRNQILQAAIEEFYENGYQKASIAKIIEKADIPRGSFYQYFQDKKELYKYILGDVIGAQKHKYSAGLLQNTENKGFIEILRQLYIGGINFYRDFPKLAAIASDFMQSRDKKLKEEILGEGQKAGNEFFIRLINQKKLQGEIHQWVDSELLTYMINALNMAFVEYFIEKTDLNYHADELYNVSEKLLDILRSGIQPE